MRQEQIEQIAEQHGVHVVRDHPWEKAGLGLAPFKLVNVYTAPGKGDGCHYCGTGIKQVFQCVSSDGKRFHVGCDCILRCHLPTESIVVEAKRERKRIVGAQRRERKAVSRAAEREARKAQWEAERQAGIARLATDPLYLRLEAHRGREFPDQMRDAMERYGSLTEAQEAAVVRLMDRIDAEPARKAATHFLGEVGERVVIMGTVEFSRCIYVAVDYFDKDRWLNRIRTDTGAVVVWFGSHGLKKGERIEGTGKISRCEEYHGERQNVVKNPRWKG